MKFQSLFALAVGVCSVFAADSQRYLLDRLQIEDTLSTMVCRLIHYPGFTPLFLPFAGLTWGVLILISTVLGV